MTHASVLIVDDRETDRYLLKRSLKAIDYQGHIFESSNGKSALDFLKEYDTNRAEHGEKFPPKLIFLDINMPIMDGFEFLQEFQKLQTDDEYISIYQTVVLIMFSSSDRDDEMEKAFTFDSVKHYLVKGEYSLETLRETLHFLF